MGAERCHIAFSDAYGVEHRVAVDAATTFEAGVRALAAFRRHPWCVRHLEPALVLEITVPRINLMTRVRVARLLSWLERSGRAPGEQRRKHALKRLLLDVALVDRVNRRDKVH